MMLLPISIVKTKEYTCCKCNWKWVSRINGKDEPIPIRCSRCKKWDWNKGNMSRKEKQMRNLIRKHLVNKRIVNKYLNTKPTIKHMDLVLNPVMFVIPSNEKDGTFDQKYNYYYTHLKNTVLKDKNFWNEFNKDGLILSYQFMICEIDKTLDLTDIEIEYRNTLIDISKKLKINYYRIFDFLISYPSVKDMSFILTLIEYLWKLKEFSKEESKYYKSILKQYHGWDYAPNNSYTIEQIIYNINRYS